MSLVPYIQYGERVVGENSPLYTDVANRPLKYIIDTSGLDDTQDFLGFASGSAGSGDPEGAVLGRVGDIYADRAATSGVIWVKGSGNNTALGWVSLYYGSGTIDTIPKFGPAGNLVNSIASESSGTIQVAGDLSVTSVGYFGLAKTSWNAALVESGDSLIGATRAAFWRVGAAASFKLGSVNGTLTAPTATTAGQGLGVFSFRGYDGTIQAQGATIAVNAASVNWSGVERSAIISFATARLGEASVTTRWRIDENAHFIGGADNTYDIGLTSTFRPRTGNFATSVIAPLFGTVSAVDVVFQRNSITQLTLASLSATFAGTLTVSGAFVAIGTNPAQAGALRLPNGVTGGIVTRNAANTLDATILFTDSSNNTFLTSHASSTIGIAPTGSNVLTLSTTAVTWTDGISAIIGNTGFIQLGTTAPAAAGYIRGRNNQIILSIRNAANTLNYQALLMDNSNVFQVGTSAMTSVRITGGAGYWDFSGPAIPQNNNAQDIGDASHTIRTIYVGTSMVVPEILSPIIDSGAATDLILQRNNITILTLGSALATFTTSTSIGTSSAFISGIALDAFATGASVIRLTRDTNTANGMIGTDYRAKDSGGTIVLYGTAGTAIQTNTAGAHGGRFSTFVADSGAAGANTLRFSVFGTGAVRVGTSTADPATGAGSLLVESVTWGLDTVNGGLPIDLHTNLKVSGDGSRSATRNRLLRLAGTPLYVGMRVNGALNAPTQNLATETMVGIAGNAYTDTATTINLGAIQQVLRENVTATTGGSFWSFQANDLGSVTTKDLMYMRGGGANVSELVGAQPTLRIVSGSTNFVVRDSANSLNAAIFNAAGTLLTLNGDLTALGGNIDTGGAVNLVLKRNGVTQLTLASLLATFAAGDIVLTPQSSIAGIQTNTVDGADTAVLKFTPGSTYSNSRGALVQLHGNEHANTGQLHLTSGNVTGASVLIQNKGTTKLIIIDNEAIFSSGYNLAVNGTGSYGGGQGVIGILNATTVPTTNPTGGGVLYSEGGALKWRGSGGTVTTLGPA